MNEDTANLLNRLNIHLSPRTLIKNLSVAEQQLVEIAKGLASNAQILVLDEPTAALSKNEVDILFTVIRTLRGNQVTIIYISHRLKEVFEIADRVAVLKDGKWVATMNTSETRREELITLMVGRSISQTFPSSSFDGERSEEILKVVDLSTKGIVKNISFSLHRGEVVGIAGLVGSGRTELALALYGIKPITSGRVVLKGKKIDLSNPKKAIWAGVGLVSEDRKNEGLVLIHSLRQNMALPSLQHRQEFGVVKQRQERSAVKTMIEKLRIATPSMNQLAGYLSGGNQQKVVIAKLLLNDPDILIFDEPTRGIDVGAKAEIYHLMHNLAEQGKGILMISSELPEILGMSDRVLVMSDGRIQGELVRAEATEEKIMHLATSHV
jgi:ribose transport system ATP-binding protein